jgi:hypothetical protein
VYLDDLSGCAVNDVIHLTEFMGQAVVIIAYISGRNSTMLLGLCSSVIGSGT